MRATFPITAALLAGYCHELPFNHADAAPSDPVPINEPAATAIKRPGLHAYVKASNTGAGDSFGNSVALSADGSTLAVGAYLEDSPAIEIDGYQGDGGEQSRNAGAVYIFTRSGTTWSQQAYIKASNTGPDDLFGASLALSADGSTLAVGAYHEASTATGIDADPQDDDSAARAGAVYVYRRTGTTWHVPAYVKASNTSAGDLFGYSVALSGDGMTLAVGAPQEDSAAAGIGGDQADDSAPEAGAVYVFARSGATWIQHAYVKASNPGMDDGFGISVTLSGDGSTLAVGAGFESNDTAIPNAGAVYVLARSGATWSHEAHVKASNAGADDRFGTGVAISADGLTLAVSAPGEASASTGIDGNQSNDSASGSGAVYVLARTGAMWSHEAYVKASNTGADDRFGGSLALSGDGSLLVVGAVEEDSAASSIGGNQTSNSAPQAGAVYSFTRGGTTWSQQAYIKASNTGAGDGFGTSVALSSDGSTLVVGAGLEDSAATGINQTQTSNATLDAGAIYLFR